MLEAILVVVFPLLAAYAAVTDFLTMTIANRVSILLVAVFLVLAPVIGMPLATFGWHLAAGAAVFAVGYAFFCFGWMGGGDVKFGAAAALWLGWSHLMEFALLFSVYGGLLTIAVLIISRWLEPMPILRVGFLAGFEERKTVPYGIALAAAALMIYPSTIWMQRLL